MFNPFERISQITFFNTFMQTSYRATKRAVSSVGKPLDLQKLINALIASFKIENLSISEERAWAIARKIQAEMILPRTHKRM